MLPPAISTSSQGIRRRAAAPLLWLLDLGLLAISTLAAADRAIADSLTFTTCTSGDGLHSDVVMDVCSNGSFIDTGRHYGEEIRVSADGGSPWSLKTSADGLMSFGYALDITGVGSDVHAGANHGLSVSSAGGANSRNHTTANELGSDVVLATSFDGKTLSVTTAGGLSVATEREQAADGHPVSDSGVEAGRSPSELLHEIEAVRAPWVVR
jgi:hypothetical protein